MSSMSVDLTPLTTFRTAARAQQLFVLTGQAAVLALPDKLAGQQFIVLGSGSNILFAEDFDGVVVQNALSGCQVISENKDHAIVQIAAGEIWHDTVLSLSASGYYGLENLALIPGTVGAAPVQNIGAYGVEASAFVVSVQTFDLQTSQYMDFSAADCGFAYRDSVFKRDDYRKRYIITAVTLRLAKHFSPVLSYQGLLDNGVPSTPSDLLQRVIAVRQSKLPAPDILPNAGSFFKNPIVSTSLLSQLQEQYNEVPYFSIDDTQVKIPTAWLLEQAGFKGKQTASGAGVYEKHALILVNRGNAHGREIYSLACDMMTAVQQQFGVTIEPEVRIIGAPQ